MLCHAITLFQTLPTGQSVPISHTVSSTRPVGALQTGLDITRLEQNVEHYLKSALSKNTMRSYTSGFRRYTSFCSLAQIRPFPTSESILCRFVCYLAQQCLKHQSIKCYLSSIRFYQIIQSHPDPFITDMPKLHYVLRGIKSEEAKKDYPQRQRLPVTPSILLSIHQILTRHPEDFDNIMIWSAFLLCFFGFLRSGEITIPDASSYDPSVHLNFNDIAADIPQSPNKLKIRIKASKTDPFRQGVNIFIGKTNNSLCPVSALLNYLIMRGTAPGLLFRFKNGSPLTKSKFTAKFRALLSQAGIDSKSYAGHSFRIGAASTAASKGVEDSLIQTLGRWKSSAYLTYVRIPPENLAALSKRLSN